MAIPLHTFEFEGSDYLRYPEDPWLNPRMIPKEWFKINVYNYLYPKEKIIKEAVPYKANEGPWASGIYFLLFDDHIIYVGMSVEILRRLNEHFEKGWGFNRYWCFGGIPKLYIEHVEAFYINALEPPYNEKYPCLTSITIPLVKDAKNGALKYIHC